MNARKGDVDEVLVALADPTRRRLLDALSARPQTTATGGGKTLRDVRNASKRRRGGARMVAARGTNVCDAIKRLAENQ